MAGVITLYVVFYMPMNILLYSRYLVNVPIALEAAAEAGVCGVKRDQYDKYRYRRENDEYFL